MVCQQQAQPCEPQQSNADRVPPWPSPRVSAFPAPCKDTRFQKKKKKEKKKAHTLTISVALRTRKHADEHGGV